MKIFLNCTKSILLLAFFALAFSQQAHAQRYLTERATKEFSLAVSDGTSNIHTFSNGIKVAYEKKGDVEALVALTPDGKVFQSVGKIPTGGNVLTPYSFTVDITTANGCRIKGSLKLFGKNRHLDVDITCNLK